MGLLDLFSNSENDAQSQAQMAMAAALLQAGGPSRTPISMGQALGGAMQSYQQTLQSAKDRQLQQDVLRSRAAFDNARLPSAMPQQIKQSTAGFSLPLNLDSWRRALQDDPTKSYLGGRKYFPDMPPLISDALEVNTSDNYSPSLCRR
ncbi:hypothetical protein [Undibacterium pigrum]|uniref:Uncharacterized protein n=1 Tax=Undibacterium pigrum TaxID=401470 RepID=A0A318JNA9_9BURK|nr:hypothetical protein [Undibacterium pigrum]PXX41662.1 hypothetical protein DFR42_107314 [Undibacterium pigrum]